MERSAHDARPDCVYGILVRDGRVLLAEYPRGFGLPGGVFRPLAADRKVELRAHLWDQLGVDASRVWAQGAFDYQHPLDDRPRFSGFYTVWEWEGEVPPAAGTWAGEGVVHVAGLPVALRVLLLSVLQTVALRTT